MFQIEFKLNISFLIYIANFTAFIIPNLFCIYLNCIQKSNISEVMLNVTFIITQLN